MDKAMQENKELRDEELYALFDKAWETERLCVSEELIQKTLKRATEETDTKVISFEKATKRKLSPMKYVGVAVAAVLVVFLGVRTLGNGGFSNDTVQMEAVCDNAANKADKAEVLLADSADGRGVLIAESQRKSSEYFYSTGDSDDASNGKVADETVGDMAFPQEEAEGATSMGATTVLVSERLAEVLAAAGKTIVSREAEYWEFADCEKSWEDSIIEGLVVGEEFSDGFPEIGTYSYMLVCTDGAARNIKSGQPLDRIVRLETEEGSLWCLLGGTISFWME